MGRQGHVGTGQSANGGARLEKVLGRDGFPDVIRHFRDRRMSAAADFLKELAEAPLPGTTRQVWTEDSSLPATRGRGSIGGFLRLRTIEPKPASPSTAAAPVGADDDHRLPGCGRQGLPMIRTVARYKPLLRHNNDLLMLPSSPVALPRTAPGETAIGARAKTGCQGKGPPGVG